MSLLTKEDFYFGSLLSLLINKKAKPALFDDNADTNKRIYNVILNNTEGTIYAKYRINSEETKQRWIFQYSKEEQTKLLELANNNLYLAFICGNKNLKNSQIALLQIKEIDESKNILLDDNLKIVVTSLHGKFLIEFCSENFNKPYNAKKEFLF